MGTISRTLALLPPLWLILVLAGVSTWMLVVFGVVTIMSWTYPRGPGSTTGAPWNLQAQAERDRAGRHAVLGNPRPDCAVCH
jgi:hypothetical protein